MVVITLCFVFLFAVSTSDVVIKSKKERPINAENRVTVHDTKKDLDASELINYKICNHFSEFKFIIYFRLNVFRNNERLQRIQVIENCQKNT